MANPQYLILLARFSRAEKKAFKKTNFGRFFQDLRTIDRYLTSSGVPNGGGVQHGVAHKVLFVGVDAQYQHFSSK